MTAPLDFMSFDKEMEIARLVREVVTVGRVIVFGGTGNTDVYKRQTYWFRSDFICDMNNVQCNFQRFKNFNPHSESRIQNPE